MFKRLLEEIEQAKKAVMPRDKFNEVYGKILMAHELKAITTSEYLELNHECVYKGINNPKYFD